MSFWHVVVLVVAIAVVQAIAMLTAYSMGETAPAAPAGPTRYETDNRWRLAYFALAEQHRHMQRAVLRHKRRAARFRDQTAFYRAQLNACGDSAPVPLSAAEELKKV